jgi:hypothetical protein
MSAAIYREFTLSRPSVWAALVAFVRGNAKAQLDRGNPLRVIITAEEKKRNTEQNRFYWGAVVTPIADQSWVDGRQFSKDVWHEYFARLFGTCEDVTLPDGEVISRRKSTSDMTVGEFSDYIQQVQAYAATNLGVLFQ